MRRGKGITFGAFAGWLKRYRERAGRKPAFAQVRIGRPAAAHGLAVDLPNGVVVRGSDVAAVANLIKRLGC